MVSSSGSGTSSGSSTLLTNSGSEEDLQALMNNRKQKRKQSNRESARRSRERKQKHLDELMNQMAQLRKENNQIFTAINITTQHFLAVDAENSVLTTQMMELSNRLQSLNETLQYINGGSSGLLYDSPQASDDGFMRPWNQQLFMNQPIMASADMFQQYC